MPHPHKCISPIQEIAECLQKTTLMLVWLQHEKDCFDNPTTYLEGKAIVVALPSIYGR